jgi:hypothetical protein
MKRSTKRCKFVSAFAGFTFFVLAAMALPLFAQEEYSRVEVGAQYSIARMTNTDHDGANFSGIGGRFDWNFTRRLAIEGQFDFFPQNGIPLIGVQGGQTIQAVVGVRGKVIQSKHFAIFGLVRPGLFHFTDVAYLTGNGESFTGIRPETHFVLNLGGGIEYYPTARWILRADIEGDPYRVPNETAAGTILAPGKIDDMTRASFGIAYRLGPLIESERETKVPGNWEFGPLFSSMVIQRESGEDGVRTEPGVGGYFSYRFYGVFYADGDVLYFPRGTNASGPHDGGEILQGLFGLKGGIRRNHFGIFGKVRPGFNSYSQALTAISATGQESYGRSTNLVLDTGGIVELYPTEHGTLRIEAGDTHIYFGTRSVNEDGVILPFGGGKLQHTIQVMVGYGWRF